MNLTKTAGSLALVVLTGCNAGADQRGSNSKKNSSVSPDSSTDGTSTDQASDGTSSLASADSTSTIYAAGKSNYLDFIKDVFQSTSASPTSISPTSTSSTFTSTTSVGEASFALTESQQAFPNPGKGWVSYVFDLNNPAPDMGPLVGTLYTNNVSWGDLEPDRKGSFRWDKLDRLVQMAKQNGMKFRFSLNSVDPTTASWNRPQIPMWYINMYGAAGGRWINKFEGTTIDGSTVNPYAGNAGWIYEPNYANMAYFNEYWRFLCELVTYWKSNPDWVATIEGMEISNYGFWGEWHSDYAWPSLTDKANFLTAFSNWYFNLFPEAKGNFTSTRMEISGFFHSHGTGAFQGESAVTHAVQAGADIARKCMGICRSKGDGDSGYMYSLDYQSIMSYRFWRSFRGEWGSWDGTIDQFYDAGKWDANRKYVTDTKGAIDEALNLFRADRLGWYIHAPLQRPSGVNNETLAEYYQKRAGYRFYLSKIAYPGAVRVGDRMNVKTEWFQRAMGKLYLPTNFAIDLVKVGGTERYSLGAKPFEATKWDLGARQANLNYEFILPANIPPGKYDVRVALVDDNRKPMINLANAGKEDPNPRKYTFYAAGALDVVP